MRSLRSARPAYCRQPLVVERLECRVVPSFFAPLAFDAPSQPQSVAAADFNGDGHLDLAVADFGSGGVSVLLGNGDGTFAAAQLFSAGQGPTSVAVGDLGNGHLDLVVANYRSGTVSLLLGKGDGTFAAARNYNVGS